MKIVQKQENKLPAMSAWLRHSLHFCVLSGLAVAAGLAAAQENAIESVSATQQGPSVVVRVALKNAPAKSPIGFSITNPARIAVDFASTANATGKTLQEIDLGDVRSVNIVQAGERSRLVLNLNRPMSYVTAVDGKIVTVTVGGIDDKTAAVATAAAAPAASGRAPAPLAAETQALRDIDFRKGSNGEGRIVVELPSSQVGVDVRQEGKNIVVDFVKASLPDVLRRQLDVTDFGTPVASVTTKQQGENVRMTIVPRGLWEHSAYQSDTQLVVEVRPIKEDPNKLTQGTQGYKGEKLSLNFQSVDVRSVLQVIADFTGLNIITSDSVSGNLTLRLKDVPWDQALDIVMQAKGLDMRKNGSVLWIAPKDELLTKEKLELEQKAQIAELEPLRTEVFQLNYLKADNFRAVFGLGGSGKSSILSKRGNAAAEPRTNKLFVTDISSKIEEVRKLLQLTDVATRQVMIEARIVEADDTFSRNLGVKLGFSDLRTLRGGTSGWQVSGNERVALTGGYLGVGEQTGQAAVTSGSYIPNSQFLSLPAAAIAGNNPASIGISLFNAAANRFLNLELSALEADGKGKIISSPRVVTADQQQAIIEQGEEIPYKKDTSSGATSVEFKKANLKLEVTPQITPDGNIILMVDVNKDSRGTETPGGLAINTKHVKTNVQVENGGTVVIGGIYTQTERNSVNQVPLLGDIPLLGHLFRNTARTNDKTELLIFITPKIVADKVSLR